MIGLALPLKFLIALLLGAVIGLERESQHEKDEKKGPLDIGSLGGVRTFALIALLGSIAGFLSLGRNSALFIIISIAFLALLCLYYVVDTLLTKSTGLTTEIAALFTFLIGFFLTAEIFSIQLVFALTIVLILILSLKEKTRAFALGVKGVEMRAFISFAVIALVILPFLPNQAYYLSDLPGLGDLFKSFNISSVLFDQLEILNPFRLWFIVALIVGIDLLGYLLSKIFGHKNGIIISSLAGGFVSSTATTQSLAQQSKRTDKVNLLVSAAIFANLASFIQIFILITPLNHQWLMSIVPTISLMILAALIIGLIYLLIRRRKKTDIETPKEITEIKKEERIFSLAPALRFILILMVVRIITKTCLVFFGQGGFLLSSILASFSGIDAIVVNLADMAGQAISFKTALLTLLLVNITNIFSKFGYSFFQGKKEFAFKFLLAMFLVIGASFIGYFLI